MSFSGIPVAYTSENAHFLTCIIIMDHGYSVVAVNLLPPYQPFDQGAGTSSVLIPWRTQDERIQFT